MQLNAGDMTPLDEASGACLQHAVEVVSDQPFASSQPIIDRRRARQQQREKRVNTPPNLEASEGDASAATDPPCGSEHEAETANTVERLAAGGKRAAGVQLTSTRAKCRRNDPLTGAHSVRVDAEQVLCDEGFCG
jgi:hypothetical protein